MAIQLWNTKTWNRKRKHQIIKVGAWEEINSAIASSTARHVKRQKHNRFRVKCTFVIYRKVQIFLLSEWKHENVWPTRDSGQMSKRGLIWRCLNDFIGKMCTWALLNCKITSYFQILFYTICGLEGHRNAAHLHRGIVEHHGTFWGSRTQLEKLKNNLETSWIRHWKTRIFS